MNISRKLSKSFIYNRAPWETENISIPASEVLILSVICLIILKAGLTGLEGGNLIFFKMSSPAHSDPPGIIFTKTTAEMSSIWYLDSFLFQF